MGERPPVLIGERVLWLGSGSGLPKGGKVRWIGRLPEMGPDWAVGLELDEALPYGGIDGTWRHRKLFMCQHKHGLIVPRSSVILQPHHSPGETLVTNEDAKKRSKDEPRQQISKPISKVSKLIRALSSDESTDHETNEHLELPSTHLRNRNLERQLSILGTLRRGTCALDLARLEIVKSEACLYSATLDKEENALRRSRRMINGREFKRSESALDRVCSINSSRSGFSSKKERSSGLFSFFRWFKKDKSDVDSDLESPPSPSSPILNHKDYSISGSVDTLFSTATARSFAFIAPSQYKPFGGANPPELRITSEPETNTYKTRIHQRDILLRQGKNITFKEKYNLHSGDTLPKKAVDPIRRKRRAPPPPETKTDSISESSLPAVLLDVRVNTDRQHRRTQSEPSQSGHPRPCHKKGKRRAPLPPLIIPEGLNTLSLRKKRPAPLPPVQRSTSDDIEPSENGGMSSQNSLNRWETLSTASTVDISQADVIATDTLKLERGYLRSNKDDKPMEMKYGPTSPVSPRPWYKRTATRDNSFSRSNERKRDRDKRRVEDWMIESGIPRRPNLLSESKINVFTKLDKNDDKRRSQISILTNISELDREAAEIVQKNKAKEKALLDSKDDKFYTDNRPVNGYFEQPFESRGNFSRDLITLFDSMAKATNSVLLQDHHMERPTKDDKIHRVVLDEQEIKIVDVGKNLDINSEPGPSGQGKIARVTIEELDDFDKERNSKAQALYEARLQRAQSPVIPAIKEVSENATTPNEEPALPGPSQSKMPQAIVPAHRSAGVVVWNCPRCTLENPRWKITCEACDMWRPVSCEFKEVNPKHPLPLAVLRIVEPKDEISTDKKSDSSKTDKTSNALTISDLLFNTGKENFNIKNTTDDSLVAEEKITNIQRTTTPQTKPTPSASESSISSLSSNNSELCQNIPVRAELEEIRKARLAFLDKLCSPNADKIDDFDTNNQKDVESVELAKLKTKFISVDDAVKTNDKCDNVERESSVKNMETSTDLPYKPSYSYEDDKRKLKEMLKEMKHSLPKRPKDGPIQNTSSDSSKCGNGASPQHRPVTRYTHPSDDKAEIYLVESETIIEEIKVRKSPEKESSAPQKGAIVRQIVPATKPTLGDEITVPITVEEYTIKDGVLYTSISKKSKKIGTGAFQLLRPRDFANIRQIKRKEVNGEEDNTNPVYANVNAKDEYDNNVKQRSYDVEKLSLQLTQPQGLAHFRAGLANNSDSANVNTLAVNRLLRRLENAIANGQHESAAALAKELSQLKVNCVVTRQKPEILNSQILVEMFVEDKQNHQGPFNLYLKPSMTLDELKHKIEKEYEIPRDVQRWIIGKVLANDTSATLESMGIVEDGSAIFLYLVVPEEQHFPVSDTDEDEEELEGAVGGIPLTKFTQKVTVQTGKKVHEEAIKIDVREVNPSTSTSCSSSQIQKENKDVQIPKLDLDEREIGWACPRCTLVNDGATQRCAACGSRPGSGEETRPLDGSDNLRTDDNKQTTPAEAVEEKKLDYQQLVDLEKSDLIICKEAFECPVCLVDYDPNEGIVLRECLHVFCRGCLANTVEYSEEAEVKCPYRDETYTCDSTLLEREIKALVEPNVYEQHLAKSIALAETKIGNAFHCKTPDCKGWCIFEDNVNLFKCPVCTHTNCLTCQAVHEGLDCKQYQERINVESEINVESRRTKEMLQEMVDRGEAMNCPTCQVVLMKKWGCDWLRCSMCKTEICWITRGPRWGPNGKGDTSGGCQCGVNGVKCHPKCTYCH